MPTTTTEKITHRYPCLNKFSKMLTRSIRIMRGNPHPLRTLPCQARMFQEYFQRKIRRLFSCVHLEIFQKMFCNTVCFSPRGKEVNLTASLFPRPYPQRLPQLWTTEAWRLCSLVSTRKPPVLVGTSNWWAAGSILSLLELLLSSHVYAFHSDRRKKQDCGQNMIGISLHNPIFHLSNWKPSTAQKYFPPSMYQNSSTLFVRLSWEITSLS